MHGLSGAAAGKQPAGVVVGGGVHVVAVVNPGEQDVGGRGGQRGWRVPEPQQDLVAVVDYVVDGQADDPAEGLGVEQDDDGRGPGPQRQVGAGEEVAEQVQSLALLKRCRVPGRRGGQPEARGEALVAALLPAITIEHATAIVAQQIRQTLAPAEGVAPAYHGTFRYADRDSAQCPDCGNPTGPAAEARKLLGRWAE